MSSDVEISRCETIDHVVGSFGFAEFILSEHSESNGLRSDDNI